MSGLYTDLLTSLRASILVKISKLQQLALLPKGRSC